jgi:hypothetical protein
MKFNKTESEILNLIKTTKNLTIGTILRRLGKRHSYDSIKKLETNKIIKLNKIGHLVFIELF